MSDQHPSLGDSSRLLHLLKLCQSLPEVYLSGDPHIAFRVGKKTFAYYTLRGQ
jgi:hypothetical protein